MNLCIGGGLAGASTLALALLALPAYGHGTHEHGAAQLDVVLDGTDLQLELSTPAANLIGFEHAPRDARQQAILRDAVAALERGDRLFSLSPAAACTFRDARVLSSLLDGEDDDRGGADHHDHGDLTHSDGHGGDAHDVHDGHQADRGGHGDHHDDHADVFVAWRFACTAPAALRELDARGLFQRFPAVQRLRVQAATPRGQSSAVLGASASVLRF